MFHSISQQLTSQSCSEMENLELAIESNLLKANLYLQQGHAARRYGSLMHVYRVCVYMVMFVFPDYPF